MTETFSDGTFCDGSFCDASFCDGCFSERVLMSLYVSMETTGRIIVISVYEQGALATYMVGYVCFFL